MNINSTIAFSSPPPAVGGRRETCGSILPAIMDTEGVIQEESISAEQLAQVAYHLINANWAKPHHVLTKRLETPCESPSRAGLGGFRTVAFSSFSVGYDWVYLSLWNHQTNISSQN